VNGGAPVVVMTSPQANQNQLSIFYGNGAGGFVAPVTSRQLNSARVARLVDVDGDGFTDLVVTASQGVSIYYGDGTGNLPLAPTFYPTTIAAGGTVDCDPVGLTVAPLHSSVTLVAPDAKDICIGGFSTASGAILYQTSPRVFGTVVPIIVNAPPTDVISGDLDGDGLPDVVMCWPSLDQVAVFYQNSPAKQTSLLEAVQTPVVYDTAASPYGAAILDVDGDGKNDLVVSARGANSLNIFFQR
jgi:hypothetical protein